MARPKHSYMDPEQWEHVQLTRPAIRARAALLLYTLLASLPFISITACGACLCGLLPHEVTGVTFYHAMVTLLFMFDSIRNAAHASFAKACEEGLVSLEDGIPVIDLACPHRRLASLSFAIGGHPSCGEQ